MSWLSNLFSRNRNLEPIDLSQIGLDLHSHLIPGIDDGAKTMEDSIAMIRKFKELGFDRITTTPHVMSDFYKNTPEIILGGLKAVREELEKQKINVEINAAAEYYLDETLEDLIKENKVLTIGENHVLFELPFMAEPPNLDSIIFELQTNSYVPILAHPERYSYWYSNFEKYQELHDKGVKLQLNMLSLIGHYSPQTQKIAERMIDADIVSFIGSDCHHMHHLELLDLVRRKKHFHQLLNSGSLLNATI